MHQDESMHHTLLKMSCQEICIPSKHVTKTPTSRDKTRDLHLKERLPLLHRREEVQTFYLLHII